MPQAPQTRRRWYQFSLGTTVATVIAFLIGLPVGFVCLAVGSHGGTTWPTITLTAPAGFFGTLFYGDTLPYAYVAIAGTAITYASYVYVATMVPRGAVYVLAFHSARRRCATCGLHSRVARDCVQ
jgi:hypothetical protein